MRTIPKVANLFFITGACGTGKSTVKKKLAQKLPIALFAVHDFDERGVPADADESWRQTESEHWLQTGIQNAQQGISTIVCGLCHPEEIAHCQSFSSIVPVHFCLLEASPTDIETRLRARWDSAHPDDWLARKGKQEKSQFIRDNLHHAHYLARECEQYNCLRINTSKQSISEVIDTISQWGNI